MLRRVDLQEGGTIISVQSQAETSFISQLQFCGDADEQADGKERQLQKRRRGRKDLLPPREGRETKKTPVGEG